MIEHSTADDKSVAKVHRGHSGQRVDIITAHPDTGSIVMANGVQEAILRRKETRRHAGIYGKGHEGEEIGECECAADSSEGRVGRSDVVVPRNKTNSARYVDESISSVEHGEGSLMAGHEPMLNVVLGEWKEKAQGPELFELEDVEAVSLGDFPDGFRKDLGRYDLSHTVEEVRDDPVEHFDQERELLQDTAVDVVGKSGCVWRVHCHSAASPALRKMFGG